MFSRFLQSTRTLLSQRPIPIVSTLESVTTEVQIQAELAEAALEGMVTTRRQSHVLSDADLQDGSEIETPRAHAKKRKTGDSSNATEATPRDSLVKRRRKSSGSGITSMATLVKATSTRKSTSVVQDLDKASDGTLESDSHERNGTKRKSAANGNKRSVEKGCDTRAPGAGATTSPTGLVGIGTQNLRQTVAVVIEGKPVDNEVQEDESSNKQTISGKRGRRGKDLSADMAATIGAVDDANKTSTILSREGHKKSTGNEVDSPAAEHRIDSLYSPVQVLKKPAQSEKGSVGAPKAYQNGIVAKGSRNNSEQHLNNVGYRRVPVGEDESSMIELSVSAPKATHKRFASEEPEPPPVQLPNAQELSEACSEDDVDDSDDDAPELLTASAGLKQVRMTAIEAARAVGMYDEINIFCSLQYTG